MKKTKKWLATIGVAALMVPGTVACDGEVWSYEMSATGKGAINGRFEYGLHAGRYSNNNGTWFYRGVTAGPQHAQVSVGGKNPKCKLIVKGDGKTYKITGTTKCEFKP